MADPFRKLGERVQPDHAPRWPGQRILVLKNLRNSTTNVIVLHENGAPCAWPLYLDGCIDEVLESLK